MNKKCLGEGRWGGQAVKLLQQWRHCCVHRSHQGLSQSPAIGPPLPPPNLQLPNPSRPPLCLSFFFFFRSVAHGAEKIVFITCQHLAALSYATQDSIKLSYTGMKLQNRPGTPQQNNFIFPPPKKRMEGIWLGGEGVTGEKWR